jgi:hypothetical protein
MEHVCNVCHEDLKQDGVGIPFRTCVVCRELYCDGNTGCHSKCEVCDTKICMNCLTDGRCKLCIDNAETVHLHWQRIGFLIAQKSAYRTRVVIDSGGDK